MTDTASSPGTQTAPLPRELTDISDQVRAVAPPPTPVLAEPYSMRVADPDTDAETVSEWMNRPHLAQAWEYDRPVEWWHGYLRAQLAGTYSRPLMGSFKGEPHGYVEVYRAAKDSIAPCYDADPYDLGLHAAIADPEFVNRGFAPRLLPPSSTGIISATPNSPPLRRGRKPTTRR